MRINTVIVALFALLGLGGAVEKANAQLVLSVGIAPPALPVYTQPVIPGPGYIWTPGCWSWNANISEYYWVPGAWVLAPRPGLLWTPGYWGWSGGLTLGTPAIGARPSASTAGYLTGSAIQVLALQEAIGPAGPFTITGRLRISATRRSSTTSTTSRLPTTTRAMSAIMAAMAV